VSKFTAKLVRDDFTDSLTGQSHWTITIEHNGYTFTTNYSRGSAYRKYRGFAHKVVKFNYNGRYSVDEYDALRQSVPIEPVLEDVLPCLIMDARSVDSEFDDWCRELGYSTDSIKARDAYITCCNTRAALSRMFDFDELCEREDCNDF